MKSKETNLFLSTIEVPKEWATTKSMKFHNHNKFSNGKKLRTYIYFAIQNFFRISGQVLFPYMYE